MRQDPADTVVPELQAATAEAGRTYELWLAAQRKVARSRKPASLAAARRAASLAERVYQEASDRRDELVQIRNARLTQRGDERGELWSRPDGVRGTALTVTPEQLVEDATYKTWTPTAADGEIIGHPLADRLGTAMVSSGIVTFEPTTAKGSAVTAPTDYSFVREWKISQLVAYFASSATRHHAVIVDGAMDLAVARELDRRFASLEDRIEQLENHPHGCTCTRCTG